MSDPYNREYVSSYSDTFPTMVKVFAEIVASFVAVHHARAVAAPTSERRVNFYEDNNTIPY